MTTTLNFHSELEGEPKPNDMVDSPGTWYGTYQSCREMHTNPPAFSLNRTDQLMSITNVAGVYYWKQRNFLCPPLEAQTISAGTWTLTIYGSISTLPVHDAIKIYARPFVWDDNTDSFSSWIDNRGSTTSLTTTPTAYTINFTGSSFSVSEGQRIGIDIYFELQEYGLDGAGVITGRTFVGTTYPSNLVVPGTLTFMNAVPLYYITHTP